MESARRRLRGEACAGMGGRPCIVPRGSRRRPPWSRWSAPRCLPCSSRRPGRRRFHSRCTSARSSTPAPAACRSRCRLRVSSRESRRRSAGRAAVDGETIEQPTTTLASPLDHFSVALDLRDGQSRIGGVVTADFAPIPPPADTTPVTLEIVVRQVPRLRRPDRPGCSCRRPSSCPAIDEIWGKQEDVLNIFRRAGYRDSGPSPDLFGGSHTHRGASVSRRSRTCSPPTYVTSCSPRPTRPASTW